MQDCSCAANYIVKRGDVRRSNSGRLLVENWVSTRLRCVSGRCRRELVTQCQSVRQLAPPGLRAWLGRPCSRQSITVSQSVSRRLVSLLLLVGRCRLMVVLDLVLQTTTLSTRVLVAGLLSVNSCRRHAEAQADAAGSSKKLVSHTAHTQQLAMLNAVCASRQVTDRGRHCPRRGAAMT